MSINIETLNNFRKLSKSEADIITNLSAMENSTFNGSVAKFCKSLNIAKTCATNYYKSIKVLSNNGIVAYSKDNMTIKLNDDWLEKMNESAK